MGTALVMAAMTVIAPVDTWNVSRMSGARTPKATRSKFWTPASATSTASGSRPTGPRPARERSVARGTRSGLDIGRHLDGNAGRRLSSVVAVCDESQRYRHRLVTLAETGVREQVRHHQPAAGGDEPEGRVAPAVDEIAQATRQEHQQADDPGSGGQERPSRREEVLH